MELTKAYRLEDGWNGKLYVTVFREAKGCTGLEVLCRTELRPGPKSFYSSGFWRNRAVQGRLEDCATAYTVEVEGQLCRVRENVTGCYLFTHFKGETLRITLSLIDIED